MSDPTIDPTPLAPGATIGWIGTGLMGGPMARHAAAAGYRVQGYARRPEVAEQLAADGIELVDSPTAAARGADAVLTIVAMPADVATVGAEVLDALTPGGVWVDMTTSEPKQATELAAHGAERGIGVLDAPVTGGEGGAIAGTLTMMVGGTAATLDRVRPVLDTFTGRVLHHGGPGAGQHAKAANQVSVAGAMIAMCEALVYADAAGLDLSLVFDSISTGAGGSAAWTAMGQKVITDDMAPGFVIEHFVKDLGIVLAESRRLGVVLPGAALAEQLYRIAVAHGRARSGTQALVHAVAELSGRPWPPATPTGPSA
ncbi:NAD(P)-dependent oxidoreductase [Propionibacteriaceae bacterium Y2011]